MLKPTSHRVVSHLTGANVGRHILKTAADSNMKKVMLELGGKSPSVILPDANLAQAAKWAAFGIMYVRYLSHSITTPPHLNLFQGYTRTDVYSWLAGIYTRVRVRQIHGRVHGRHQEHESG
jgi:hypothetical protein